MERNLENEIDDLKKELCKIKELLAARVTIPESNHNAAMVGHVEKMPEMHEDPNIMTILNQLEDTCGTNNLTGAITYLGVFASNKRQPIWIKNNINTDALLELITNKTAEKVLSCIGNNDRLNILLAILKKPMTVAEIVEECKLNSSGQACHHMKPLLAADLIKEDESFSKGTWEETDDINKN